MQYIEVLKNNTKSINEMSQLASKIVKEHYDPILGEAQNDYMIEKFQSPKAIAEQLQQDYKYFFVSDDGSNKIGFIAYYPRVKDLYLSKFYLDKSYRGQGLAKEMLSFLIEKARELGRSSIVLNVNKTNNIAICAYEKLGFIKVAEEKNPIGNGYFMDDYVYQLSI